MPHYCGHTHARRARHNSERAQGGVLTDTSGTPDSDPGPFRAPTHEEIAELAYSYWEAGGCVGGSALQDWLRAEKELTRRKQS